MCEEWLVVVCEEWLVVVGELPGVVSTPLVAVSVLGVSATVMLVASSAPSMSLSAISYEHNI